MRTDRPDIFLGLDVGKTDHWACALTDSGQVLWNKTLPNNEQKLTDIYTNLSAKGSVLVVVDQPATIGALAIALAFSLILGATGTLIHQASDVFDRAEESAALMRIGLPYSTLLKARLWQVIPPLLLMLSVTIGLGALLGTFAEQKANTDNLVILVWVVGLGIALTLAAVVATAPIQAMVLSQKSRKND